MNNDEMGSSLRAGSLVLIVGILVAVALMIAFWFLLEQADQAAPPPLIATIGDAAVPPWSSRCRRPHHRSSTGSCSGWSHRRGRPASRAHRRRCLRVTRAAAGGRRRARFGRAAVGDRLTRLSVTRTPVAHYPRLRPDGHAFDDAGILGVRPRRRSNTWARAAGGSRQPPARGRLAALVERDASAGTRPARRRRPGVGALREIEREPQAPLL